MKSRQESIEAQPAWSFPPLLWGLSEIIQHIPQVWRLGMRNCAFVLYELAKQLFLVLDVSLLVVGEPEWPFYLLVVCGWVGDGCQVLSMGLWTLVLYALNDRVDGWGSFSLWFSRRSNLLLVRYDKSLLANMILHPLTNFKRNIFCSMRRQIEWLL